MAIEILTSEEVAELLRLPVNRILMLARRGEILSLNIDGRLRFEAGEVEDWLKSHRNGNGMGQSPPRQVGDS